MLRGGSAEALAELTAKLGSGRTQAESATLGEELFGVVGLLRRDAALRRALTDNSVAAETREALARAVFGRAVGSETIDLVADAASRRWTAGKDLPDALERLAVIATVRSAGKDGETLGDELFAIRRLIDENPQLRAALSDQTRSVADRTQLIDRLIGGRTLPATRVLVHQAIGRGRGTLDSTLEEYLDVAAESLEEKVATVHSARELSGAEQERLAAALSKHYGNRVQLHVVVDPQLVGGIRVEIGDDVIDGTVAGRLADARRRLVG